MPARGYRHPRLQVALDLFVGQSFGAVVRHGAWGLPAFGPLSAWSKIQEISVVFDDIESLVSYSRSDDVIRVRVDLADEKLEALAALLAYPLNLIQSSYAPFPESVGDCLDAEELRLSEVAWQWWRFNYLQPQTLLERELAEIYRLSETDALRERAEETHAEICAAYG